MVFHYIRTSFGATSQPLGTQQLVVDGSMNHEILWLKGIFALDAPGPWKYQRRLRGCDVSPVAWGGSQLRRLRGEARAWEGTEDPTLARGRRGSPAPLSSSRLDEVGVPGSVADPVIWRTGSSQGRVIGRCDSDREGFSGLTPTGCGPPDAIRLRPSVG